MRIGGGDHRKFMVSGTVYLVDLGVNLALARFWMNMRKLSWLKYLNYNIWNIPGQWFQNEHEHAKLFGIFHVLYLFG